MQTTPPPWLAQTCADILRARTAGAPQDRYAHQLGARAAEAGITITTLVQAALAAASDAWNAQADTSGAVGDVHARAAALIQGVRDLVAHATDGYEHTVRDELARRDTERDAFLSELLAGRADPGRLAQRAHRYGIRLSGRHQVAAVRTRTPLPEQTVHRIDDALAARYGTGNILTTVRDDHLICITAGGLRGVPAELAHLLVQHAGPGTWQIGVGRPHPGVDGLATSLDEARNALDLATRLGFTTPVLNAADLLVFPVLLRDRDAITDLVSTVLGPLAHARGGPRPLLDTLNAVFEHQGNHTAAARHLRISVRAVTYRLDRVHTLTGYHHTEPTQRFTLHAAVLGARLLDWPHQSLT